MPGSRFSGRKARNANAGTVSHLGWCVLVRLHSRFPMLAGEANVPRQGWACTSFSEGQVSVGPGLAQAVHSKGPGTLRDTFSLQTAFATVLDTSCSGHIRKGVELKIGLPAQVGLIPLIKMNVDSGWARANTSTSMACLPNGLTCPSPSTSVGFPDDNP